MSFDIVVYALLVTSKAVFLVVLALLMLLCMSFILRSKFLGLLTIKAERFVFGFFGLFKCINQNINYSYLGIEIHSNLATAVLFSIGVWVLGLHVALVMSLLYIEVASPLVLFAASSSYLAYPLILYALRKKCD